MNNQDERREVDELSEILNRNKERRATEEEVHDFDETGNISTDSQELARTTVIPSQNKAEPRNVHGGENEPSSLEEDLHDIDFDEETDKPMTTRAMRRAKEARIQLKKQRQARKTVFQIIFGIVVSAAVIFFGVRFGSMLLNSVRDYGGMDNSEFQVMVEIPEDPTIDDVVNALESSGIITDPDFFKFYFDLKKNDKKYAGKKFVGGEFTLTSSMNYGTIVSTLLASQSSNETVEVTIIEGMTSYEVAKLLEENFVCRAEDFQQFYRDKMNVYDFELRVEQSRLKFNQLEGYLFPDKYEFYVCDELKAEPDAEIDTTKEARVAATKIYSNFNSKITKTMYKQMHEMGLTLDQLITLASMVQSEVSDVEDMRKVASVFLNRLETGGDFSKLQSDVTVFYVQDFIEPYYKDYGLSTSLAAISNAYDTYECDGVPAGPICNPGMDAINAVLDAEETEYYYFCANEETGETFYASTLEGHQENLVLAGLV